MPFSELHQLSSKGKFESAQARQTNCSSDLASVPDNEFVELVWENGQIMMQGQSSKSRKNPSNATTGFTMSHMSKPQDKDQGDAVTPKFDADSVLNDFSSSGPSASGNMGLAQEDDLVRWLTDPLGDDCSDFFSELSGENLNALSSSQANAVPTKSTAATTGNTYAHHALRDSHMPSAPDSAAKPRPATQLRSAPPPHHFNTSLQSSKFNGWNSTYNLNSTNGLPYTNKMEKQDTGPTSTNTNTRPPPHPTNTNSAFLNFSHFLRPALKTSNVQSCRAPPAPPSDRFRNNDKVSAMGSTNAIESTVIESTSGSRSTAGYQISQPLHMPPKLDDKPSKDPLITRHSEAFSQEDTVFVTKNRSSDQAIGQTSSFCASTAMGKPESEKVAETTTAVASSSVCSGNNSAGGTSNDLKHLSKRKSRDTEESEYPSEDVEEESVAAKKPGSGRSSTSTKRTRAAEVHNLSERRRRDRINEKMRALQELIPNCNKVDKASMLDEAIEYLKTLQLQVQIMSMGTGLCMPPMMLSPGMQRMHAPHMSPFSPMGVGMGMGMGMGLGMGVGFGMGMLDMGGASSACPLIQVPPMHGPQFPCGTVAGPSSLPTMTGSNAQMFGIPGQGLPITRPPFIHMPGAPSIRPASSPIVPGQSDVEEVPDSALRSSSKDQIENLDLQMSKTISHFPEHQVSKEGFEQSAMAQKGDQNKHDGNS